MSDKLLAAFGAVVLAVVVGSCLVGMCSPNAAESMVALKILTAILGGR